MKDKVLILSKNHNNQTAELVSKILIGEWCRSSEKDSSELVLPYHWNDRRKAAKDFDYIYKFRKKLTIDLGKILNSIHESNFSVHAWDLMLGYWLNLFLTTIFDRFSMLKIAEHYIYLSNSPFNNLHLECIIPADTSESIDLFLDDYWNHIIMIQIISKYKNLDLNLKPLQSNKVQNLKQSSKFKTKFKTFLKNILRELFRIPKNSAKKYTFSSTGIPLKSLLEIKFKLLDSINLDPDFPEIPQVEYDVSLRNWIPPVNDSDSAFEKLAKELIPFWMPTCFLEGFKDLNKSVSSTIPHLPDVVFTSTSHFHNDSFKCWAANQIDLGSKLVIALHGGGVPFRYNGGLKYEEDISDYYVVPGTSSAESLKKRAVGQFWSRIKKNKWEPAGEGLMVTVAMPSYAFDLRSMAISEQMLSYFDDQFLFYGALPKSIQRKITVRLYPSDLGWNQKQRWQQRFPNVQLDEGEFTLSKQAKRSRLFISTYLATTHNEALAANIPTVMYWNPNHWEWAESADHDFAALKSAGIYHDNPQSAARHVAMIWDDVGNWWYSSEVQFVRKEFCRKYAYLGKDVIRKLAAALKEAANHE